jgi:hypothetical protein
MITKLVFYPKHYGRMKRGEQTFEVTVCKVRAYALHPTKGWVSAAKPRDGAWNGHLPLGKPFTYYPNKDESLSRDQRGNRSTA